jgi:hypothetical protein
LTEGPASICGPFFYFSNGRRVWRSLLSILSSVEYTFLYPGAVENERVIDEGLDALQRYLLG